MAELRAIDGGTGPPLLEVRRLRVQAAGRPLLADVAFRLVRGEVVALMGPSGVGKSTLLRCLNRLAELSPGLRVDADATLGGEPIYGRGVDPDALRRRLGMLFQQPAVFPKSIRKNLTLGLRYLGVPRRHWNGRVEDVLRRAALWSEVEDRLDEPATTLSVGQQQRLCLARALAVEPLALLLDEPTSALDPAATRAVEDLVRELRHDVPVLLVTHDPAQAARVADRILQLRPGPDGAVLGPAVEIAPSNEPAPSAAAQSVAAVQGGRR